LHAWWFDIAPGQVLAYASDAKRYVSAVDLLAKRCGVQSPRFVA